VTPVHLEEVFDFTVEQTNQTRLVVGCPALRGVNLSVFT
jgi:hypothetical protein